MIFYNIYLAWYRRFGVAQDNLGSSVNMYRPFHIPKEYFEHLEGLYYLNQSWNPIRLVKCKDNEEILKMAYLLD